MRRYQVGHTTLNTNVLIRAEIHDSLLGVASSDELVGDGTIQYSHQRLDPSQYTEIQNGELGIGVHIQTNAHRTLRNDILNASEGRFELYLYLDGVFEWKGVILPDLCEFTESFDEVLTLKAKDFTLLKKDLFPLEDVRETIYTTIAQILSGFSLDVVCATSWTETNVGSDFIQNIYHETRALRIFGEDDRQITNEEALKWILRSYGMTLKQSGGKLRIDQFTAYADPTAVRISTNGGSGANQSLTQVSSPITIDSTNQGNFGIKRVTNTFNHRTEVSEPKLPTVLSLESSGLREKTFTFNLTYSGEEVLSLRSVITATSEIEYVGGVVEMTVRAGNQYWDGDRWVAGQRRFKVNLEGGGLQVEGASTDSYAYTGTLSIRSTQVPEENPLEITFRNAKLRTRGGTEVEADATLFDSIEFVIDALSGNDAIGYQIEQAVSFTESVDHPVTYFGDFPNLGSPASLRYGVLRDELTNSTWQRIGGGDVRLFHSNLLHEILDPRRGYRRVLNATIKGTFEPHKVLSYDSTFFYYLGGTFDGYTGNWSVQVVEIDVVDQDEQIDTFISEGVGSGGFGQGVNFNLENLRRILLLAGAVGLTNADYDEEEITEIDLDLNQPLREGFEYWVINSSELNASDIYEGIYPFMPDIVGTSNSGLVTLPIDKQTMNAPKGSLVILAPSQAATNQTRMESISSATINGVEINAQAVLDLNTDIGNINGEIDGIDVDLGIIGARAVLFTDVNGNIASITLLSGTTGSAIDIKASQVKINGVLFDDNGMMRSTSFNGVVNNGVADTLGTLGWAIDRSGQAIFHNIKIRGGDVTGIVLTGNVGAIRIEATLPAAGNYTGETVYVENQPNQLYRWNGTAWISTLDGDDLLVNSVTAGKINVATLSAIQANLGNVVVGGAGGGQLVMKSGGIIRNDKFPSPDYIITDTGFTVGTGSIFDINLGANGTVKGTNYTLANTGITVQTGATFDINLGATGTVKGTNYTLANTGITVNTGATFDINLGASGTIKGGTTGELWEINRDEWKANYTAGIDGFILKKNGDAEFNSVTVRNGELINSIFIFPTRSITQAAGTSVNALTANAIEVIKIQITVGDSSGGINLNGIVPITVGESRVGTKVTVMNSLDSVTPSSISINNESGSATAVNRVRTPTGSGFSLARGDSAELFYDVGLDRWLIVSSSRVL